MIQIADGLKERFAPPPIPNGARAVEVGRRFKIVEPKGADGCYLVYNQGPCEVEIMPARLERGKYYDDLPRGELIPVGECRIRAVRPRVLANGTVIPRALRAQVRRGNGSTIHIAPAGDVSAADIKSWNQRNAPYRNAIKRLCRALEHYRAAGEAHERAQAEASRIEDAYRATGLDRRYWPGGGATNDPDLSDDDVARWNGYQAMRERQSASVKFRQDKLTEAETALARAVVNLHPGGADWIARELITAYAAANGSEVE